MRRAADRRAACAATAASTTTAPTCRPAPSTGCPPSRPGRRSTREPFGTEVLDVPLDTWPEHFPNVAQARHLITAGVPEPLIATLTRIGTVEGFGANIRLLQPGDLQRHFDEDIRGHRHRPPRPGPVRGPRPRRGRLGGGGRATRTCGSPPATSPSSRPTRQGRHRGDARAHGLRPAGRPRRRSTSSRRLPDDIDVDLELIADLMIRVLLIEMQAFHTFAWAEDVAVRPRPRRRRRRGRRARVLHPGRRDAARRLPQDRPHRDARPHLDRHRRARSTPAPR